jgi:16S rRNA (adenine1518-N6/adenine1519-N6)-dimethyltransferase
VVLEVGTGLGSLTTRMAPQAHWVVTIEIDSQLQQMAHQELRDYPNITMLHCDALRNKNHLREEILEEVRARMRELPNARFKLVANLPYNVATPIISNLLMVEPRPARMVVTIQRELAERIVAVPSTKDYSALSIWLQSQCDCRIVRLMPPSVFWPRPNVDSAIIEIVPNPVLGSRIQDLDFFHEKLRALFFHRRKFIRSQVAIAMQDELTKPQVDTILESLAIDPNVRAEQLTVEKIIILLEACRQASSLIEKTTGR